MKKLLVLFVVLLGSLALAGTVFADGLGLLRHADCQDAALQRPESCAKVQPKEWKNFVVLARLS